MDKHLALPPQKRNGRNLISLARVLAVAIAFPGMQALSIAQEAAPHPPAARTRQEVTVDALSVVKLSSKAISNARSSYTLGPRRE